MKINRNTVFKGLNRFFRIITGRKGIYGKFGKGNVFIKPVIMTEGAKMGNYNYVGPYVMLNNTIIGSYCSFGPSVKLGQGEHSKDYLTTYQTLAKKLINHSLNTSPAIIGNDVWLGANVIVLQGVNIGDGAIIGASSVVTKDIPPYSIAFGIPAKVIRKRFNEETIKDLVNSEWYYDDIETAELKLEKMMKHNENTAY